MSRIERLLDLLDRWDEAEPMGRCSPEEFCKDHIDLFDDFVGILRQRGVISALLSAEDSPAVQPQSMVEEMQTGRFSIVQFHDQGGLGWVYLAKDNELGRTVALKCLKPEPATDPLARERFIREAEITARLDHPGIVPIYGLGGISLQEFPYYTMRFIQGETLRHAIRTFHSTTASPDWRSLDAIRLLRAFVTVCETVAFAHSRSVIHRDLKSSNVMLGAYGETLVLDWGLARVMNEPAERQTGLLSRVVESERSDQVTQDGATLGTVGFMSPEQALGDWSRVGPPSDIFSLGAILYQILTNKTAYHGERALLDAQSCRYPPPSDVKYGVPASLAAICLKAMRSEPSQRYSSAIDLKQDVELFLADEQVTAKRDSVVEGLRRWMRKHRSLVQIGGWMGFATIVMLSVFLSVTAEKNRQLEASATRERQATEEAVLQRDRASAELRRTIHENHAANMAQVSQALSDREPVRHVQGLMRSRPRIGSPIDPRGPEWWMNWGIAYGDAQVMPYSDVLCAALIDEGRKSAIWTAENELSIVDHASGQKQFARVLSHFSIRTPRSIPVSSDGSTVAIPNGLSLQIHRIDGASSDLFAELDMEMGDERVLDEIALSNNGSIVAVVSVDGTVRAWDLAAGVPFRTVHDLGRVYGLRLSPDGRFLAFFEDERPVVFELATGTRLSLEGIERGEFHGLAFGQYDTLVIWSNDRAMSLGIDHPTQLTQLWLTPLPCPTEFVGSRTTRIEREVVEWILLDSKSQGMTHPQLNGRLKSGDQPAEVHATILVTLGSNGTQMFYREPGGTYPVSRPLLDSSAPRARITEFTSVRIKEVVDTTWDGGQFLLRRGESEYLMVPRSRMMSELVDVHSHRGEIGSLAWASDDDLLSLSKGTTFLSPFRPGSLESVNPEVARWNTRTNVSLPLPYKISGSQATASDDGKVLASFDGQQFRVHEESQGPSDYQFRWELPESLFDNGTVRMVAWNRFEKSQQQAPSDERLRMESVIHGDQPERASQLDLPWMLVFQNERDRDPTRALDRVTTRLFIMDYQQSKLVHTVEIPFAYVESVAIRSDGREFAVGSSDQMLRAWSIADDHSISPSWQQKLPVNAMCISYRGNRSHVAAGDSTGDVHLVGLGTSNEPFIRKAHEGAVTAIAFSEKENRLITAGADNTVRMFDTVRCNEVFRYSLQHRPTCLALNPKTNALAIGDSAGHIVVVPHATKDDSWQICRQMLRVPRLAVEASDMILRELWADFVGITDRTDDEIDLAIPAIDSVRGILNDVDGFDQLQFRFRQSFPPGN